jgi:hypothetical protein
MSILAAIQKFIDAMRGRYRPELHYMRGPGPKCLAKALERGASGHAG